MAKTIDELVVRIKADTKQLQKALEKTKKQTNSNKKGFASLGLAIKKLKGPAKILAIALAAIGAAIMPIARVGAEFENLKLSLNTVFGSINAGQGAFDRIKSFAKQSPFQIQEVTKAFIQLRAAGIEPNEKMLKTFADAASVAIDSLGAFQALVRITQRSKGGGLGLEELEQLSDRGIPVYEILAEKMGVTRLAISDLGKTAEGAAEIMAKLNEGLDERFGGAVDAKMQTLNQRVSNMKDSFSGLAETIFEDLGVGTALKFFTDLTADAGTAIDNFLKRTTQGISQAYLDAENNPDRMKVLEQENITDQGLMDESNKAVNFAGVDVSETKAQKNIRKVIQARIDFRKEMMAKLIQTMEESEALLKKQEAGARLKKESGDQLKEDRRLAEERVSFLEDLASVAESTVSPITILEEKIAGLQTVFDSKNAEDIASAFAGLLPDDVLETLNAKLQALRDKVADTDQAATDTALKEKYGDIQSAIQGTVSKAQELQGQIAQLDSVIGDENKLAEIFPEMTMQQVKDGLALLREELVQIGVDAQNASMEENFGDLKSAVEGTVTPFETLKATIANLQTAINDKDGVLLKFLFGARTPEEIEAVMVMLRDNLKDIKDAAEDTSKTLGTQLQQAVTNAANAFTTNFVNALMDGKNALGAFKDFAKSMVSQIIAIFLQMAIVNEILNSVFNLQGTNRFSTISNPNPTADNASGGHYSKGKPMLVGERGPELIIPNTGGRVMNGMNTKNAMGGGSTIVVNQSLNFSTGVVGTVRAEINKMMPTIAEVSKSAVLDASRRGGNFRKGLLGA